MTRLVCLCVFLAMASIPAQAALKKGETAPGFEAQAAKAGKQFTFKLEDALKSGPVVLYFFPAANTRGCDLEAHTFSEDIDKFAAYHATVIGVSEDDIGTLTTYSANPDTCAGNLAVAADADGKIMKAYDVVASENPANAEFADRMKGIADRATFVIVPDGEIIYTYTDLRGPVSHVTGSLDALKAWADQHGAQD